MAKGRMVKYQKTENRAVNFLGKRCHFMKKVYDNCCGIDVHKNLWLPALSMAKSRKSVSLAFQDLDADYYNQFNKESKINVYLKKLKALGWEMPEAMEAQPA